MKIDYGERYDVEWRHAGGINYLPVKQPKTYSRLNYNNVNYVVYTNDGSYYQSGPFFIAFGWFNNSFLVCGLYTTMSSYSIEMPSRFRSSKTGAIFQSNEGIGLETLNKLNKEHRIPSIINNELLVLRNKRKELIS